MTEVSTDPNTTTPSPLTEEDIQPFFNTEELQYGPFKPASPLTEKDIWPFTNPDGLQYGPLPLAEQEAFLEKHARAQRIVDCLHSLEMVQKDLSGRGQYFDIIRLNLFAPQRFLREELEATGLSSAVWPSPPPPSTGPGTRHLF